MRKSAPKTVIIKTQKMVSVDDQLAEHLSKAEHHLIEAVKLFSGQSVPERVGRYQERLQRAQETVTALHSEELVRKRGKVPEPRRRK